MRRVQAEKQMKLLSDIVKKQYHHGVGGMAKPCGQKGTLYASSLGSYHLYALCRYLSKQYEG